MIDFPRPIVRMKPKADAKAIRNGAPWVYGDDIVTDRRTKALAAGTLVTLQDSSRSDLGLATINPSSRIMVRLIDKDPSCAIDRDWFAGKLVAALALRSRLFETPYYRLVHAEADGLPGVIIDRFGDVAVVQPNAAWAEARLNDLVAALREVCGVSCVLKNASGRARGLEGLDDRSEVMCGSLDGPVPVPMNGATYFADLLEGQKTGLFYDQRPNHAFAASLAKGADVLDVFSHVGGFGLAALAHGAQSALAVDGSQPALDLAQSGAARMGVSDRFSTQKGDAFKVMQALADEGRDFNLVIADPPAFAPHKRALQNGLTAYARVAMMAAGLVRPGGYLVLCSCSHAADLTKFRQASLRGVARAGRDVQIIHIGSAGPDHPTHPYLAESSYLKSVFLRLD
ncbi:MAG: class I SAM-dependent rRNA methyltransferase [Pseudomonadota bacterium]